MSQQNVGKVWAETEYLATNKSSGPELFSQFRAIAREEGAAFAAEQLCGMQSSSSRLIVIDNN